MAGYTAPPIAVTSVSGLGRAELVFAGVDQAGPSFEGRVFLNNPDADETTAQTPETGYAGSFYVYGYGEPAPPAIAEARQTQAKGSGPIAPIEKRLHPDETAVRTALEGSDKLAITVVPIASDSRGVAVEQPFERVDVVFERTATEP